MMVWPPALDDASRLAELRELAILDTPPEPDYDDLATVAAVICRGDVAAVNFVDATRHFAKAAVGMPGAAGMSVANETSFCAATVQRGDGVLIIPDAFADRRWSNHPLVVGPVGLRFYAGATIMSHGQPVGTVCAFATNPHELDDRERSALRALSRMAAAQLELRRRNHSLVDIASRDPLTGVANRRRLMDGLQRALEGGGAGVGLLFCDVDDFKQVNDNHGHAVGDRLLCHVADVLRSLVREGDLVARLAGDEFVVLCPHVRTRESLEMLSGRIRKPDLILPGMDDPLHLSVGAVQSSNGDDAADVLHRADREMYVDKAASG